MAEKEGDSATSEVVKTEDLTDNTVNEEPSTSFETIAQDANATRNDGPSSVASRDKGKKVIVMITNRNSFLSSEKIHGYHVSLRMKCQYTCNFYVYDLSINVFFLVDILLKATGNAPIMKQKKWTVIQDYQIGRVSEFMRRYLRLESSERLVSL